MHSFVPSCAFLFRLLTRTEYRGLENVPAHGPYIVLTNHLSAIDPPLILAVIPAPITVFAADTHRHEFFVGELMNAIGAIWVRRGEADREALQGRARGTERRWRHRPCARRNAQQRPAH